MGTISEALEHLRGASSLRDGQFVFRVFPAMKTPIKLTQRVMTKPVTPYLMVALATGYTGTLLGVPSKLCLFDDLLDSVFQNIE